MSKKIKDAVVYGCGTKNFSNRLKSTKFIRNIKKLSINGETAVYVSMRKLAKNGRSSVFRFCPGVNHCLNNKIVLLISTKIVNSTILWGLNFYTSSVNSACKIQEIGILLKCANLSCCFLFSFGKILYIHFSSQTEIQQHLVPFQSLLIFRRSSLEQS